MHDRHLRCATWNVHRARGMDSLIDPERIARVIENDLAQQNLHVLALQEADAERRPHAGILDIDRIARATGLVYVHDAALRWGPQSDGFLGTILFLAPSLTRTHADIIDLPGHCHRGAVAIEVVHEERPVRLISTHMSLGQPLRLIQMRIIGQYLRRRPTMQTILLGDLNEWRPWGGAMFSPRLIGAALRGPVRATFPSTRPLLPLDRILTTSGEVCDLQVLRSAAMIRASDHRAMVATVTVP
ncbi:MAG: endonuclease/exonuclease/phosphatase family protein [Pseudomonadota bacterium]